MGRTTRAPPNKLPGSCQRRSDSALGLRHPRCICAVSLPSIPTFLERHSGPDWCYFETPSFSSTYLPTCSRSTTYIIRQANATANPVAKHFGEQRSRSIDRSQHLNGKREEKRVYIIVQYKFAEANGLVGFSSRVYDFRNSKSSFSCDSGPMCATYESGRTNT